EYMRHEPRFKKEVFNLIVESFVVRSTVSFLGTIHQKHRIRRDARADLMALRQIVGWRIGQRPRNVAKRQCERLLHSPEILTSLAQSIDESTHLHLCVKRAKQHERKFS